MTRDQLLKLTPDVLRFADPLLAAMQEFEIRTPAQQAMFLAQVAHESGGFRAVQENLNYSAESLRRVFAKYFPGAELAASYAHRPARIASRVYAGRLGNGPEESGDGFRFRGRGLIQITFRDNYRSCSIALYGDERLLAEPELLVQATPASRSAAWYWCSRNLNSLADAGDLEAVTRKINGGLNGLEERREWLARAQAAFAGATA